MRNTVVAYAVALGAVATALVFRLLVGGVLTNAFPLVTLLGAVALAVWVGNYRSGLVAVAAGLLVCLGLLAWPQAGSPPILGRAWIDLAAFLAAGLAIVAFGEHLHRVKRRIECKNREIDLARKRAEESERRKDEFLATLSHELRNPLAAIRNSVEIMKREDALDGKHRKGGAIIERQLKNVSRLLEDLLDLSRMSHGKLVLRKERVEIGTVVQDAVERSRALIGNELHEIRVATPPAALFVDADPMRLSQVLGNLFDNAAKYSDPGMPIEVRWDAEDGELVVCIKDRGIGISPELLDRVFEMFFQSAPALTRSQGGLGIGLSLSRHIIQLHGGSLHAKSDGLAKGSEFIVRLPLAAALTGHADGTQSPGAPNAKHRVLVVDDSADSADSLAMILSLSGHEVRAVYDGEAAIEAAASFGPDVIFMDVGMPGVSGIDACRRIKAESWGQGIHIVALTGWGQEADRQRTAQAGFHDHLVKPVDPAELIRLLSGYPASR